MPHARRRMKLGLLALASLAATLMVLSATASADFRTNYKNENTKACLAWRRRAGRTPRTAASTPTRTGRCTRGDGTIQLRPTHGGNRCLDDSRFGCASSSPAISGRRRSRATRAGTGTATRSAIRRPGTAWTTAVWGCA